MKDKVQNKNTHVDHKHLEDPLPFKIMDTNITRLFFNRVVLYSIKVPLNICGQQVIPTLDRERPFMTAVAIVSIFLAHPLKPEEKSLFYVDRAAYWACAS